MKYIIFFSIFLPIVSLAQTESDIPACDTNKEYNSILSKCIPICSQANNEYYEESTDRCQKDCPANQRRDPFSGDCKTAQYSNQDLGEKIVRRFHVGDSCSTNNPKHRYASEMLHKNTTDIYAFENLFIKNKTKDRFNLLSDISEMINDSNNGFHVKRNKITIKFNKDMQTLRESFNNLRNAKFGGTAKLKYLDKQYVESDLARAAQNPGSDEQYLWQIRLSEIKNKFYSDMYEFYENYYSKFREKQKLAANQSTHNSQIKFGPHASKRCKGGGVLGFRKDVRNCWSHRLEVNSANAFQALKDYKFNYREDLVESTKDQELSIYEHIFSYDHFKADNGFQENKNYFIDFPANENLAKNHWKDWNKNKGNNFGVPLALRVARGAVSGGIGFIGQNSNRSKIKSSDYKDFFKDLLATYESTSHNTAQEVKGILNSNFSNSGLQSDDLSSAINNSFIYPELGVKTKCLPGSAEYESEKCKKSVSIQRNIIAKTMKYFFLYANNSKKDNLADMFEGRIESGPQSIENFDKYEYTSPNNRGLFFGEISHALVRARDSYKYLRSPEYFDSSVRCIKEIMAKFDKNEPIISDSDNNTDQQFNQENSNNSNTSSSAGNFVVTDSSGGSNPSQFVNRDGSNTNFGSGTYSVDSNNGSTQNLGANSSTGSSNTSSNLAASSQDQSANGDQSSIAATIGSASTNSNAIDNPDTTANTISSANTLASSSGATQSSQSNNSTRNGRTRAGNNNTYSTSKGSSRSSRSSGNRSNSSLFANLPSHSARNSKTGGVSASRRPANTNAALRARGLKGPHSGLFKKITDVYVENAYPTIFGN